MVIIAASQHFSLLRSSIRNNSSSSPNSATSGLQSVAEGMGVTAAVVVRVVRVVVAVSNSGSFKSVKVELATMATSTGCNSEGNSSSNGSAAS